MGGCCGAMKTGQKSLPDKKKSPDVCQEKSNGKEVVAQTIPATETEKTPVQTAAEDDGQPRDNELQNQELIVPPVKVSVNAAEREQGVEESVTGAENVMDLETAVAPFESIVSNDQSQPNKQRGNDVPPSTESEFLLPYQIPVQHTFTSTTTATTTYTKQEEFQTDLKLHVDEPQFDAAIQGDELQLAITETVQALPVKETFSEAPLPPVDSVDTEIVTEVKESEAVEVVPDAALTGNVELIELTSELKEEAGITEPETTVRHTSFEADLPQEEILPSEELQQHEDFVANELVPETEVSHHGTGAKPTDVACPPREASFENNVAICPPVPTTYENTSESNAAPAEPEPILLVCPPCGVPDIPFDQHNIAVCPSATPVYENTSESDAAPAEPEIEMMVRPTDIPDISLDQDYVAICPPAPPTYENNPELEAAAEQEPILMVCPPREMPDIPLDTHNIAVCPPDPVSYQNTEQITTDAVDVPSLEPFQLQEEPNPNLVEELATQEQAMSGGSEVVQAVSEEDRIDSTVVQEYYQTQEETSAAEDLPKQPEEEPSRIEEHLSVGVQPEIQPYQEQQLDEPSSYQDQSIAEPTKQEQVLSEEEISDVIPPPSSQENSESLPVLEEVPDQSQENRANWWKEGGEAGSSSEASVLELLSDQTQEVRQTWWEQSGKTAESSAEPTLSPDPLPSESVPDTWAPPVDHISANPPLSEEVPPNLPLPVETEAVSPSSDPFPEVIPEPLNSTYDNFDQGIPETNPFAVESPVSVEEGSTVPAENGEVSRQSSDEVYTPASVVSPAESSTPESALSPEGIDQAASTKEPIVSQA